MLHRLWQCQQKVYTAEKYACNFHGCASCYIFFKALEKKIEILFCVDEVEALLQFLVCALAGANCKCAYTCALAVTIFISHVAVFIVSCNALNLSR